MRAKLSPNISLGNPIVSSVWALHEPTQARLFEKPNDFELSNPQARVCLFIPQTTTFLKANAILNQTNA
ncbi:hypothetical protein JP0169_04290 [Helicobacter pylori]|nr:hypothetical protein HPF209_1358 [Helicobacter pylori]